MTEHFFDHDRLDVYRLSIEYVANAFDFSRSLEGFHRHARDQWLRAAQSITKTSTAMLSTNRRNPLHTANRPVDTEIPC